MKAAEIPSNEEHRLRTLFELDILDTLEEQAYDDLTKLAAEICQAPIALVSLIDQERQWFKSHHGMEVRETPREFAFCAHAILGDDVLIVEDSSKDTRFHDNPLATGEPHVRFYAGAPLIMSDKSNIGTLCVIGHEARTLTTNQREALAALARQVVSQMELRLRLKEQEMLDHTKDEFITMVSHELRTPLTAIYGSLSILTNKLIGELNVEQKSMADISFRNSARLLTLVNDILDLAKLESGRIDLQISPLNLHELLAQSIELNKQYCASCNTQLTLLTTQAQKTLTINGDEQRLLQVLCNLISNAAKFTYENDVIEIDVKANDNYVTVEVSDHGPGIPLEQRNLLFKKFQQLSATGNKKTPGTGLGLNISKKIIELHQGEVGFSSIPEVKTTFYFTLPLLQKHAA